MDGMGPHGCRSLLMESGNTVCYAGCLSIVPEEQGNFSKYFVIVKTPLPCSGFIQVQVSLQDYGVTFSADPIDLQSSSDCVAAITIERPCVNYTEPNNESERGDDFLADDLLGTDHSVTPDIDVEVDVIVDVDEHTTDPMGDCGPDRESPCPEETRHQTGSKSPLAIRERWLFPCLLAWAFGILQLVS